MVVFATPPFWLATARMVVTRPILHEPTPGIWASPWNDRATSLGRQPGPRLPPGHALARPARRAEVAPAARLARPGPGTPRRPRRATSRRGTPCRAAPARAASASARRRWSVERLLGVVPRQHLAGGQVVQLHPGAGAAQRAGRRRGVHRERQRGPGVVDGQRPSGRSCSRRRRRPRRRGRRCGRPGPTAPPARCVSDDGALDADRLTSSGSTVSQVALDLAAGPLPRIAGPARPSRKPSVSQPATSRSPPASGVRRSLRQLPPPGQRGVHRGADRDVRPRARRGAAPAGRGRRAGSGAGSRGRSSAAPARRSRAGSASPRGVSCSLSGTRSRPTRPPWVHHVPRRPPAPAASSSSRSSCSGAVVLQREVVVDLAVPVVVAGPGGHQARGCRRQRAARCARPASWSSWSTSTPARPASCSRGEAGLVEGAVVVPDGPGVGDHADPAGAATVPIMVSQVGGVAVDVRRAPAARGTGRTPRRGRPPRPSATRASATCGRPIAAVSPATRRTSSTSMSMPRPRSRSSVAGSRRVAAVEHPVAARRPAAGRSGRAGRPAGARRARRTCS